RHCRRSKRNHTGGLMKRRLIWCLSLGTVAAIIVFLWLGVTPWTIAMTAVLLVCPAIIIWGAMYLYRDSHRSPTKRSTLLGKDTAFIDRR
ncbi:MAG TPA: hypothetical protein VET48_10330, partial [Steroidobacteraceae bacterium]|nr:hypothetical protein [Steroidobacteraceae bacterium]